MEPLWNEMGITGTIQVPFTRKILSKPSSCYKSCSSFFATVNGSPGRRNVPLSYTYKHTFLLCFEVKVQL